MNPLHDISNFFIFILGKALCYLERHVWEVSDTYYSNPDYRCVRCLRKRLWRFGRYYTKDIWGRKLYYESSEKKIRVRGCFLRCGKKCLN